MFAWLYTISLVLAAISLSAADDVTADAIKELECPFLCVCTGNIINCSKLTIFPEDLPRQTAELYISKSSVPFIPLNVFLNLPRLDKISLTSMTIETIRACSFAELENVSEISFNDVSISVIEGNAFSNLYNVRTIAFESCGIREMKSFSFHNVTRVTSLKFSKTNISAIHPYSFLKFHDTELSLEKCEVTRFLREGLSKFSNTSRLVIKSTDIKQWQCGSLKTFSEDGNVTRASVTQSILGCSCSLSWLWSKYPDGPVITEESNRCNLSGTRLSQLKVDDVCPDVASRDSGCPPLLPSTPHSCSRKFDTPYEPEEKVDYPKYFTRKPASDAAILDACPIRQVLIWTLVVLVNVFTRRY